MNLPTVIVCEEAAKRPELETLVKNQTPLVHLATVGRQTIQTEILAEGVKVIWIELSPDPQRGLKLLVDLKDKYPRLHFLVSYSHLEPDLVKAVMQAGAVEYLDEQSVSQLLEPAIARIVAKEEATPAVQQALPVEEEPLIMEARGPSTPRPTNPMRSKLTTPDLNPNDPLNSLPPWLLPALVLVMVVITAVVFVVKH